MSPLSIKHWSISLAPHRVCVAERLLTGGVRLVAEAAPARPDWTAALATLGELLPASARGGLHLVISSHWLHYQMLPWNELLARRQDAVNVARAQFARVYGNLQLGSITLTDQGWGKPVLACAIPAELEALIATNAIRHGVRLASLRPDLQLLRVLRPRRHKGTHATLLGQPGLWLLLAGEDGVVSSVRTTRFEDDATGAAALLLRQEALRLGFIDGFSRVDWVYPEQASLRPPRDFPAATYVPELPGRRGFVPATDGAWAFAVLGA